MTIPYTPKDLALDALALALILAPEPSTTVLGIGLLCRKRGSTSEHAPAHPVKEFPDYQFRVETIRGREITWEVRTIYPGQLPHHAPNKPPVTIKPREELILAKKIAEQTGQATPAVKLPPDIKVHHTIIRPPKEIKPAAAFVTGETIHHTIRQYPQVNRPVNRKIDEGTIHHTVKNSPAYLWHITNGKPVPKPPPVIHHSIKDSPAMRGGNPAGIVKPLNIKQHHTIIPNPKIERPIVPPPPPRRKMI